MIPPSGSDYYLKRELEERAAAAAAVDPGVRRVHFQLADRYAERARMEVVNPPLSCGERNEKPALP